MELVRIGDLALRLDLGDALGHVGIHADIQILGFGNQQQLIDLVAQNVLFAVAQSFLQAQPSDALLAQSGFERLVLALHFALGNDVAIDLTNDLFDDPNVRGGKRAEGEDRDEGKAEMHIRPLF